MTSFITGPLTLIAVGAVFSGLFRGTEILGRSLHQEAHSSHHEEHHERQHEDYHEKQTPSAKGLTIDLDAYTIDAQHDFIRDLPGLGYDPGFNQFAGYLTVDPEHGRNIFYWYVESQGNPAEDPVVLWTNGGPGCSGFVGFGTEMGPYYIRANGTLSENPFSWNKLANMLYIEQPAGVGFSYSDTRSDYKTGDDQVAKDNYLLIREFLTRFPERQNNHFYISSESYGGHYMPQLTLEILQQNTDGLINFQGMMVGNPYVDPFSNTMTQIRAFYSHGLLPKPLFDEWSNECTLPENYDSKKCTDRMEEMFKGLYGEINPYALDYPVCIEDQHTISQHSRNLTKKKTSSQVDQLLNASSAGGPPFLPTKDVYRPCSEEHLDAYLNRDDVRKALHVSHKAAKTWSACSDKIHYSRKDASASIISLYKDVVQRAIEEGLQIFIYSGDDDSVCSTTGTQSWIYDVGFQPKADCFWKAWKTEGEVAGYATRFELGTTDGQFTFATVHGAGHEVPAYRPMEALEMFRMVLAKEW